LVYLIPFSFTSLCANCTKNILNHRAHRAASRYTEKPIFKKFGLSFSSSMLSMTSVVRKKVFNSQRRFALEKVKIILWFTSFSSHSLLIVQKQYLNHRAHRGASRYIEKTNNHKEIMRRFALEEHKLAKFLFYLILFSFTSLCANCTKKSHARNKFNAYGIVFDFKRICSYNLKLNTYSL
jgi:hypothetical protein